MNKKPYTQVEIEVVLFQSVDDIVASSLEEPTTGNNDTDIT